MYFQPVSNKDLLNWSADLRRISGWLQTGNVSSAQKFIYRGKQLYPSGRSIAGRTWQWWLDQITVENAIQASERALTWSLILSHRSKM